MARQKEINGAPIVVEFSDFTGGINTAIAPQLLGQNEYQSIHNMELELNQLVTRGGLSAPLATYPANIKAFFYDDSTNCYIVCLVNGDIYEEDLATVHRKVGTLSGTRRPHFCRFDSKVFIASGGKLQYFSYAQHTVTTIQASRLCDFVFERFGRIVITHQGDDNLYYSAVGDPYETGWGEDANEDNSAKFIEIGYKDDGDILKVLPISGDIAIFKTNGRIYILSGEYPNWTVQLIGDHSDAITAEAIADVGSTIAFMSKSGLKTLQAVQLYGNFGVDELGRKFNKSIIGALIHEPRIYNITRKRQLLVCPDTSDNTTQKRMYLYQYDIGAGMTVEFSVPIADMQDTQNGVLVASGTKLYRWSREFTTDNGTAIEQEIVTREFASTHRIFTRKLDVGVIGMAEDKVYFKWADKKLTHTIGSRRRVHNIFSVCRKDVLKITTTANIKIDYVKFYAAEV